jgi:hypothetical protein
MPSSDPEIVAALSDCPATRYPELLARVVADPAADEPRRALAAALTAAGSTYGELVSLQLELDALDPWERDGRRDDRRRVAAILRALPRLHALVTGAGPPGERLRIRRGLVEHATLPASLLRSHGETIFALAPLTSVDVFPVSSDDAAALGRATLLARLRHLGIAGRDVGDDGVRALLASTSALESLDLFDTGCGDATLARLALVPKLRRLMVDDGAFSARGAAALVAGPSAFESLALGGSWVDDDTMRTLAGAASLRDLRALKIVRGRVAAADDLVRAPFFRGLRELTLTYALRDAGALQVALASLERVERLHIEGIAVADAGVAALAAAGARPHLRALSLCRAGVGPAAAPALALPALRALDLTSNALGDAGLVALAAALGGSPLTRLALDSVGAGPAGVEALLGAVTSLVALDLSGNHLGDAGAEVLARSPALERVEVLRLAACGITDAGARALLDSPHLAGAANVVLGGDVSQSVRDELRARRAQADPFLSA